MEIMIELTQEELDLVAGGDGSASFSVTNTASGTTATVTGTLTILGAFAFLEYALSLLYVLTVGVLIAFALLAAIALCSLAFRETTEQAVLLRNVTVLSTFAWIGLAFIAAYHIVWVVFILTLISLWPLKATSAK